MKVPAFLALACLCGLVLWAAPVDAATLKDGGGPFVPNTDEFAAAVVMVPKTHQILYSFKPDLPRSAASLTKLANALAFLKQGIDWNTRVSIKKVDEVGGGRLRVKVGTKITVRDLFYSSITASANNAAMALARITGLGLKNFVKRMNAQAKLAGAKHSSFVDPSGMDPDNMTTARDMALLAEKAFAQRIIGRAASSAEYRLASVSGHTIKNTNLLLTQDPEVYVLGGKTGYLEESAYNLVVDMRPLDADGKPDRKKELIISVLGAPSKSDQFTTAKRLAEWAWDNYRF